MDRSITEIVSPNQQYKAVIIQRTDRLYTVTVFAWTHEYVEGYGEVCDPYWSPIVGPVWTDTPTQADRLAREELRIRDSQIALPETAQQAVDFDKKLSHTIKSDLHDGPGQIWVMIKLESTWFRSDEDRDMRNDIIAHVEDNQLGKLDGTSSGAGAMDVNFDVDNKREAAHKLDEYMKMHHKDITYYISDTYETIFDKID